MQAVSLSGGKDSTALLLMLLEKGERVDEAIFFDTGWEFPEMYEHLDKLEHDTGVKITRLKPRRPFEYMLLDHVLTRGEHAGQHGYGFARPNARWCTKEKTATIDRHLKTLNNVTHCIGIAADEDRPLDANKRYPLIEWGITEPEALNYCYARGYTWEGLYENKKRVSCWCCPLQSLQDLRVLRRIHPELWQRLRDMEARSFNSFRIDYNTEQLEQRFSNEDKQLAFYLEGQP